MSMDEQGNSSKVVKRDIDLVETSGTLLFEVDDVQKEYTDTVLQTNRQGIRRKLAIATAANAETGVKTTKEIDIAPTLVAQVGFAPLYCDGNPAHSSAMNTAGLKFFNFVKGKVRTLGDFDNQDVMGCIIKTHTVRLGVNVICRVLDVWNTYSKENYAYGYPVLVAAVDAMFGVDSSLVTDDEYSPYFYNDLGSHIINIRKKLTDIKALTNSLALPAGNKAMIRQATMVSTLYQDDPGNKSSLIMFTPSIYQTFDPKLRELTMGAVTNLVAWASSEAGKLEMIDGAYTNVNNRLSQARDQGYAGVGALIEDILEVVYGVLFYMVQDHDMTILSAAITEAFDLGVNADFETFDFRIPSDSDKLVSVYDEHMCMVLRNATITPVLSQTCKIHDDSENSVLIQGFDDEHPGVRIPPFHTAGTTRYYLTNKAKLMNVFRERLSAQEVMSILSWNYILDTVDDGPDSLSSGHNAIIHTCGTEVITGVLLYYDSPASKGKISVDSFLSPILLATATSNILKLSRYLTMGCLPGILLFNGTSGSFTSSVFADYDVLQYWDMANTIPNVAYRNLIDYFDIHYTR